MSGAQDVLANAARRIGYYAPSDPHPGSEAGRYWAAKSGQAWLAGPSTSIWWCMLFVSMVFDEAGQVDAIGGWTYNTDVCISHARARGLPFVTAAQAQPGDVVIFNWDGGSTDHVGVVERNLGGGWIQTIEGNTSSGAAGSQSAGNGVWRRRRHDNIAAIIRPEWRDGSLTAATATQTTTTSTAATAPQTGDSTMNLVKTTTPWGSTVYFLITESAGATSLDDVMAQGYNAMLGRFSTVDWDMSQALVRQAWERVGLVGDDLTKRVSETIQTQAAA